MDKHYLNRLFEPKSVAVFGASDRSGSVGNLVFKNMIEGDFAGEVYPINPKHDKVQGQKAYADLNSIGKPVDLVVITTPASTVPGIIESCVPTWPTRSSMAMRRRWNPVIATRFLIAIRCPAIRRVNPVR